MMNTRFLNPTRQNPCLRTPLACIDRVERGAQAAHRRVPRLDPADGRGLALLARRGEIPSEARRSRAAVPER